MRDKQSRQKHELHAISTNYFFMQHKKSNADNSLMYPNPSVSDVL